MPELDFDYGELLSGMIDEYYELNKASGDAISGDATWKTWPEFTQAMESLSVAIDTNRENPLIGACTWWQEHQGRYVSGAQRIRHLWRLLKEIDRIYSTMPIIRCGRLVLGKRWWNVVSRCDGDGLNPGFLDGPELMPLYEFPHLRVVDFESGEWIGREKTKSAFEKVFSELEIRIGLCSLSGRSKTVFRGTRVLPNEINTVGFLAQGININNPEHEASQIQLEERCVACLKELKGAIRWARRERINILCFPELCICEVGRELLRKDIESDPKDLVLVVPGSYHVNRDVEEESSFNTAPIWLVEDGVVRHLCDYKKNDPMVIELDIPKGGVDAGLLNSVAELDNQKSCKWIKEDIKSGKSALFLDTPIGVIGIAICKDMLWYEKTNLQRYAVLADHILVVSMNRSPDWFWPNAKKLAHTGTGVFYVNTPQLVSSKNAETEIAFWHLPKLQNVGVETRVCYSQMAPTMKKSGGLYKGMEGTSGRVVCPLDFKHPRFLELMVEP